MLYIFVTPKGEKPRIKRRRGTVKSIKPDKIQRIRLEKGIMLSKTFILKNLHKNIGFSFYWIRGLA